MVSAPSLKLSNAKPVRLYTSALKLETGEILQSVQNDLVGCHTAKIVCSPVLIYKRHSDFTYKLSQVSQTLQDLQKEDDSGVGHSKREAQDPTAHNGITEVKHRHPNRGMTWVL